MLVNLLKAKTRTTISTKCLSSSNELIGYVELMDFHEIWPER